MKRIQAILGAVAMAAMSAGLYAPHAQAGDVCHWFTFEFENKGFHEVVCGLPGGWAMANSLSGYANPGVKGILAELVGKSQSSNLKAYAYAVGFQGTQPVNGCMTPKDTAVDGQSVTTNGQNCNAATRHRLTIGNIVNL